MKFVHRQILSRTFKADINNDYGIDTESVEMETVDRNRISDNDMAYDSMYDRMEETAGRKNSERSENNYDTMYSL